MGGYSAGRGSADITGEAAECGLLGYGKSDQQSAGIHTRQRSRAFVIDDGTERVLLVVNDMPLLLESIHLEVLKRLKAKYGELYTAKNVMITATHTHCGPGGYSHHRLYNSNTHGFRTKTFEAIVGGIVEAATKAHEDLAPTKLSLGFGELYDASINRSRSSFDLNPEADKAHFPKAIDPQVTLLQLQRKDSLVGVVTWFATHGTSMTNRNRLISSDNKGYAAYKWERVTAGVNYLDPSDGDLVAAFAQTNTGDMSPNLNQAPGSGPTEDEFENTRIIGNRQFEAGSSLLDGAAVEGPIDSRVVYVNLSQVEVRPEFTPDGKTHRTSPPMAAAAAMAGTDEGKGFPGFKQGRNPFWDTLSKQVYYRLSPKLRDAQAPKGIVLPAGFANKFVPMITERVPVQLLRLGSLYLIGIPGEVTIVAGLRMRRTVSEILGVPLQQVLVAGYSNGFIHYVTTPEEYENQRYEGGSTMFGKWEAPALGQIAAALATAMRDGKPVDIGDVPAEISAGKPNKKVVVDEAPEGKQLGDVVTSPLAIYAPGAQVLVDFVGVYPNNLLLPMGSYIEVQRKVGEGWQTIADDSDWETKFHWKARGNQGSDIRATWDIPSDIEPGSFRVIYNGHQRDALGQLTPVLGQSPAFKVAKS